MNASSHSTPHGITPVTIAHHTIIFLSLPVFLLDRCLPSRTLGLDPGTDASGTRCRIANDQERCFGKSLVPTTYIDMLSFHPCTLLSLFLWRWLSVRAVCLLLDCLGSLSRRCPPVSSLVLRLYLCDEPPRRVGRNRHERLPTARRPSSSQPAPRPWAILDATQGPRRTGEGPEPPPPHLRPRRVHAPTRG